MLIKHPKDRLDLGLDPGVTKKAICLGNLKECSWIIMKMVSVSTGTTDLTFVSGSRFTIMPCLGKSGDFEFWKIGELRKNYHKGKYTLYW